MPPTLELVDDVLHVRLRPWQRVAGLLRDLRVPVADVSSVEVLPDGLAAVRGLRAPGLALPSTRYGTWRRRRQGRTLLSYVAVDRGVPALRLGLTGSRFADVLVSSPDAEAVAARLRTRG
jgi:hypothetical protein